MAVLKYRTKGGTFNSLTNMNVTPTTVVQTPGDSTTSVMSQKAVVEYVGNIKNRITVATASGTSLTAQVDKLYRFSGDVNTLTVTLPAITDLTTVRTVVIYLTAGTTPAVTITSADSKNVYYQDGFEIEAGSTYEINALFNGDAWIVASVKINTSNS